MPYEKSLSAGWTRGVIISLAVAVIFYVARSILIPLALSVLLSFVLTPIVSRIERIGLGRVFSVTFTTGLVSAGLFLFVWMMTRQVIDFSNQLPEYKTNLIEKIKFFQLNGSGTFSQANEALAEIQQEIAGADPNEGDPQAPPAAADPESDKVPPVDPVKVDVVSLPPSPLEQLTGWLGPALHPATTISVMFLLTIFILLEREDFHGRLIQLFASSNLAIATQAINEASAGISRWLQTMFLINTLYGAAIWTLLASLGIPNPLLWGVLGFMCRFLPYVGPWLAGIFPLLMSLAVFETWTQPLILVGAFVAFELTINLVLEPFLYGKSIGLSPLGVILAVLFWAWLWGPAGIILALPLTLWLVVLGRHIPDLNFFAVLFGDLSEMPNYHSLYQRLLAFNGDEATACLGRFFQNNPLSDTFEQLLIPLLQRTELDRRVGAISQEQVDYIYDAIDAAVDAAPTMSPAPDHSVKDETSEAANVSAEPLPLSEKKVLVMPISTRADEIGAKVLIKAAANLTHVHFTVVSTALAANEIIRKIEEEHFDLVLVTGLSPFTSGKARLLIRRLQNSFRHLPIMAGLWKAHQDQRPEHDPATSSGIPVYEKVTSAILQIDMVLKQDREAVAASEMVVAT